MCLLITYSYHARKNAPSLFVSVCVCVCVVSLVPMEMCVSLSQQGIYRTGCIGSFAAVLFTVCIDKHVKKKKKVPVHKSKMRYWQEGSF